NRMAEVNTRIAEALEGTNVSLGKGELQKLFTQVDLFRRQIQDYDDRHDLRGLRKQELKNQLDIQVASCALLWVRERAARKGIELTDAQIALVWEQVYETASQTDLNDLDFRIKSPQAKWSDQRDPVYSGLYGLPGSIGSVVSAVTSFYEGFQMDHDRFSNGYQPQRNLDRVRRSFSRTRSKYKGK
ncbi:hypothetical protein, partial [Alistipes communis]|uniref:hypothetical protein n=1 Tax=Alistipes communis TaxID=2585118 RepID=UPI00294387C8